ncbi:regulator of G-protein signaling 7 [Drosophila guanche]|uniref:Blast:Regulator of G-protein signaling 7 n=1 Tax=Drosophila guanche TaxID=7266 RepID=A0A3B0J7N7_DROGU|nr:regulator of G-protein signaling 7 [Drosophila guanche]SPP78127.1 blast:Regulator of G-protein signaling 7 [Drosophila guanche]
MVTMNSEADKTQATNATLAMSSAEKQPAAESTSPLPKSPPATAAAAAVAVTTECSAPAAASLPPVPVPAAAPAPAPATTQTSVPTPAPEALANGNSNANIEEVVVAIASTGAGATVNGGSVAVAGGVVTSVAAATPPPSAKTVNVRDTTTSAGVSGSSASKSSGLLTVSSNHHHHHHHQQSSSSSSQQQQQQQAAPSTVVVQSSSQHQRNNKNEDAPNILVYKKMEAIIEKMQAESTGVAVRTVKAFMSKVPSVFTGADLVAWILKNFDVEDVTEALHFAHLLSSHGYIFPIDDHALTVKNDGTFYRFQTPYFWPSNCWEPENTDYAVYLCKRTMQNKTRLELADYEAENLAKLQKMFSRKWEFIFMQAESQSKVAKKRDKLERKVLDSQERAFWDVHRPMPGCVNTTEIDIKKAYRRGGSSHGTGSSGASVAKNPVEQLSRIIALRKQKLERRTIKVSKAAEALVAYYDQYNEFDYFITSPELPNPWQTDSTEMWDTEKNSKEVPVRRVKRWAFSLRELLNDAIGRDQFTKFLEKEYSGENLKFWESVQEMKALPQSEIKEAIHKIWQEFLAPDAPCPVNVDSKSVELAREAVNSPNGPNRWCFDVAASHVYHLMKSDSYSRYLRSDMYKDYLNCSRKKIKSIPNLFGVKR